MTVGAAVRHSAGMAEGLSRWQPTCLLLVVIPAQAGIQEGSGAVVKGWQVLPDARLRLWRLLSFPLCGNGLSKALDSGLRRNDDGGCGQAFGRNGRGAVKMATHLFPLRRHSSEGWNPGGRSREMMEWQVLSDGALVGHPFKLSFPLAGMDCLNHWIPRRLVPDAALSPTSM